MHFVRCASWCALLPPYSRCKIILRLLHLVHQVRINQHLKKQNLVRPSCDPSCSFVLDTLHTSSCSGRRFACSHVPMAIDLRQGSSKDQRWCLGVNVCTLIVSDRNFALLVIWLKVLIFSYSQWHEKRSALIGLVYLECWCHTLITTRCWRVR